MIIGLGYRARSGKDTVAEMLRDYYGFTILHFADPLKEAARQIFGFSSQQTDGDLKETMDPYWGFSPREALQKLGTEAGRGVFGEDLWVNALRRRIAGGFDHGTKYVIPDVRFLNEASAIQDWGGLLWRVDRQGAGASQGVVGHPSETQLDGFRGWDLSIDNNGTIGDLREVVARLMRWL